MTAVSPVQFGSNAALTDLTSIFLKVYTGSFETAPRSGIFLFDGVAANRYIFKPPTAGGGKSFQFLMGSDVPEPEEFDPGDDLLGQVWGVEEGTITTDKYHVCHKWIGKDRYDEAQFQGQILPQLAVRHRNRIERLYDKRAMIKAAYGARQTSAVTKFGQNVHNGGNRVTTAGGAVATAFALSTAGAAAVRAALRALALLLDQDNVGGGPQDRGILLDPYIRSVLSYDNTGQLFSKDYVTGNDQQRHQIDVIERFAVLGYPNTTTYNGPLPNQNLTDGPTKYQVNFSAQAADGIPWALALCRSTDGDYGLGSVQFEGVQHVVKYVEEKLAWLVMTYIRTGVDVMHPWCLGSCEVIT